MGPTFTAPGLSSPQVTLPPGRAAGTVVLVSSGVDSTLAADLHPDATLLFVDFGQDEIMQESARVRSLFAGRHLERATVEFGLRHSADGVFVPARNLMLACLAAHYGDRIVMGGMKDDRSIDKTPAAFDDMSVILTRQCGYPVTVESPFFHRMKHEAVADYLAAAPDAGARAERRTRLSRTWSCYGPGPEPCLRCKACFRWAVALRVNGIDVPLPHRDVVAGYLRRLHIYEPGRQWAILTALHQLQRVAMVDLDGVVTEESEGQDYAARTPRAGSARRLAEWRGRGGWVVLHTARPECDREVTERWLAEHEIPHDGLVMDKLRGTVGVDDRMVRSLDQLLP